MNFLVKKVYIVHRQLLSIFWIALFSLGYGVIYPYIPYENTTNNLFIIIVIGTVAITIALFHVFLFWLIEKLTARVWPAILITSFTSFGWFLYLIANWQIIKMYHMPLQWMFIKILFTPHGFAFYNLTSFTVWIVGIIILLLYVTYIALYTGGYYLAKYINIIPKWYATLIILMILGLLFMNITTIRTLSSGNYTYYANTNYVLHLAPFRAHKFLLRHPFFQKILAIHITTANQHILPKNLRIHLQYPLHPLTYKKINPPNILLLVVDTLAYRFMVHNMPFINSYATKNLNYTHNYSTSLFTRPATFGIFYSLTPNYLPYLRANVKPIIWTVLQKYHYKNFVYFLSVPAVSTLESVFPHYIQAHPLSNISKAWKKDYTATKKLIGILRTPRKSPMFITVYFSAVHDLSFPKFGEVNGYTYQNKACYDNLAMATYANQQKLYACYENAAHFDDFLLQQIIQTVHKLGEDNHTIIIITADHGEEVFDHNTHTLGHGSYYNRFQSHVPLIVHWPRYKPKTIDYRVSNYDIIPTLMQSALGVTNPLNDYSMGRNLLTVHKSWGTLLWATINTYGQVHNNIVTSINAKYSYIEFYNWNTGKKISNMHLSPEVYKTLIQGLTQFNK